MNMFRKRIALLAAFTLLAATPSFGSSKDSEAKTIQEIRNLRDRWIKAEETKDIPFLRDLLTNDAMVGNSQGQVLDKEHFLKVHADPERTLKELNADNIQIHIYNGDTAVLTEHIVIDGNDHGKPFGGNFRFVRIFVRQDNRWRVALGQGTPIK
jgi:ketosteroid isomerase-like protein